MSCMRCSAECQHKCYRSSLQDHHCRNERNFQPKFEHHRGETTHFPRISQSCPNCSRATTRCHLPRIWTDCNHYAVQHTRHPHPSPPTPQPSHQTRQNEAPLVGYESDSSYLSGCQNTKSTPRDRTPVGHIKNPAKWNTSIHSSQHPQQSDFMMSGALDMFEDHKSRISFDAAATRLFSTLELAIAFFHTFQQQFSADTQNLRVHTEKDLLDQIWRDRISYHESHPAPFDRMKVLATAKENEGDKSSGRKKRKDSGANNLNGQDDRSDRDELTQRTKSRSPHGLNRAADLLSFTDLSEQIIARLDQLRASRVYQNHKISLSLLNRGVKQFDGWNQRLEDERRHSADLLMRKVQTSGPELLEAMDAMRQSYASADRAIHELQSLRDSMSAYRRGWDSRLREGRVNSEGLEGDATM